MAESVTVEEATNLKKVLEHRMLELLSDFEDQTGLCVHQVEVSRMCLRSFSEDRVESVKIGAWLP